MVCLNILWSSKKLKRARRLLKPLTCIKDVENVTKKPVVSQVHEVAMHIKFRGDYVNEVKKWLLSNGF